MFGHLQSSSEIAPWSTIYGNGLYHGSMFIPSKHTEARRRQNLGW